MTDDRRSPPEQVTLESQFGADEPEGADAAEPAGIDAVPLVRTSETFPEEREPEAARVPDVEEPEPAAEQASLLEAADPEEHGEPEHGAEPEEALAAAALAAEPEVAVEEPAAAADPALARFGQQWVMAGICDLSVHLAIVAVGAAAAWRLGLPVRVEQWPGYLGFALSFSFLYTALPLAFWGQTPGMAVLGFRAQDGERQLSFGQTFLRWTASVLTIGLAGLPLLLARSGRPLADRLSGSETLVWHEPDP